MNQGGFGFRTTYAIEVRHQGDLVGERTASIAPCREDALFAEIISGRVPNDGAMPRIIATPVWDELAGDVTSGHPNPPTVAALDLSCEGGPLRRYEREVFSAQASALISDLVQQKKIEVGDPVVWDLTAREDERRPTRLSTRVERERFPLTLSELPDLAAGEVAAELDPALLDQLRRGFCESGAVERAWLLVGSVEHDPKRGAALVHGVTAVDVAEGRGGASQTHFAFEPRAFVEARERALREFDGLVPIGWAHTHPPCEACPQNLTCPSDTRFFSSADVEVHTAAFPSAFMIALVVGKAATAPATEPGFRLYGWREARMNEVAYRVSGSVTG